MESKTHEQLGDEAFKAKDYQEAIDQYTEEIDTCGISDIVKSKRMEAYDKQAQEKFSAMKEEGLTEADEMLNGLLDELTDKKTEISNFEA